MSKGRLQQSLIRLTDKSTVYTGFDDAEAYKREAKGKTIKISRQRRRK